VGIPSRRTFADYRIHEDRLPFAGVLTWEVADDTRNLPESSLNIKTSPKFIPFQFFSATDDALRKMLISEKPDLTADDCDIDLESVDRHLNELVNPRG
jgi:hypothetical protein